MLKPSDNLQCLSRSKMTETSSDEGDEPTFMSDGFFYNQIQYYVSILIFNYINFTYFIKVATSKTLFQRFFN